MFKKLLPFILFTFLFQICKAQNEFITIWQPSLSVGNVVVDAPFQANSQQIWFPGIGENYDIYWEEIGFPQHNGSLINVTSTKQVLIDFGTPLTADVGSERYRVKVTNGSGTFKQIRFGNYQLYVVVDTPLLSWQIHGSTNKILEIEQWGNINWLSMNSAFSNCTWIQITAKDAPNLTTATDASFMFYNAVNFLGHSSMANWNTSHIQNFQFMFSILGGSYIAQAVDAFNPPYLSSWNTSSATNFNNMFSGRKVFNQSLNTWNTSNVTDMAWMFASCLTYNQRLDNWNTSNVTNMAFMLHFIPVFQQSLDMWDTSKVTNMTHMFHGCTSFNNPLHNWDTSKVTKMSTMFSGATSYNQSLASWDLSVLTDAESMLSSSGLNCDNYSKTLAGWADNPNTHNNVVIGIVNPLQYASNAVNKRNILLNKGWTINGDTVGSCFLQTSELKLGKKGSIYPNPVIDDIHVEGIEDFKNYRILDASGRLIKEGNPSQELINVSNLSKGNYILQIMTKEGSQNFKFIKE
jgi:surface protein